MSSLPRRIQLRGKAGETEGLGRKLGFKNSEAKDLLARLAREEKRADGHV